MRAFFALAFVLAATAALTLKHLRVGEPARAVEPAIAAIVAAPEPREEVQLTITLAGDTGLNGSFEPVYAGFATKHGQRLNWREASEGIAREIEGDVVFANLETVVTDRNDLSANPKLFGFRTHPDAVRHLADLGFNVFSTANNHAMDFGLDGARETLKHLKSIAADRGLVHAGLGANRSEAAAPQIIARQGLRVAVGALGIIGGGYASPAADEDRPGQLSYFSDRDFADAADRLSATEADYRILSVHYGREFEPTTDRYDRNRFRDTLAGGLDLIVGHHQHVVAGVEVAGDKIIFYGLGNFLHLGTQDMARFDVCRDYGLLARVHVAGLPGERLKVRAIEALPITAMHRRTARMTPEDGRTRIHVLNHLAKQLDDGGASRGVRFAALDDGSGLYCAPGAERLKGRVGTLCAADPVVALPEPKLAAEISEACSRRVVRTVENEADFDVEPGILPALLPPS